jgi:hypothetical protein
MNQIPAQPGTIIFCRDPKFTIGLLLESGPDPNFAL